MCLGGRSLKKSGSTTRRSCGAEVVPIVQRPGVARNVPWALLAAIPGRYPVPLRMMKSESAILTYKNPAARTLLLACALAWLGVSSALAQTTNTTTTLGSSANPSCFGQSVTFTAAVAANPPDAGTPTGTVDFKDGGTTIDTEVLDGLGQASFSTSTLAAGMHSI